MSESSAAPAINTYIPFPPIRRVVTGHTPDGKSTIIHDDEVASSVLRPGVENSSRATRLWSTFETPADNSEKTANTGDHLPERLGLVNTNGTYLTSYDIAPGAKAPLHRTSSIDYLILISGEVTAILEDGSERTITEPGSIVVQRGTLHKWENRGTTWTKFVAILVDATPVQTAEGVTLQEGFQH